MRAILLFALLAACGGDDGGPDPHEIVPCAGYTPDVTVCEAACSPEPMAVASVSCNRATNADAETTETVCPAGIDWNGHLGCCMHSNEGSAFGVRFYECE